MADRRLRLTDDLIAEVLRSRSLEPPTWLRDEIVRAAETTPQVRGRFRFGPIHASPRIVLIAAIALLLAAAGVAIGARLLLPEPAPLLHANGEIVAADEGGLVSVDPETGERTVIEFCDGCRLPSWSANGSTLAFVRAGDVVVRDMAAGEERVVTTCGLSCSGISLSGDGSLVAYSDGRSAVVHDLEAATEVVYSVTGASDVAISPNGEELLITGDNGTLRRVRLDGEAPEEVIDIDESGPLVYAAWSPDGDRIAYVIDVRSEPAPTSGVPFEYQLWVVDADGSNRHHLWSRPGCCMRAWGGPSWSPDGTQIAAVASSPGPYAIYIVSVDGSDVRRVADAGVLPERAAWRPKP